MNVVSAQVQMLVLLKTIKLQRDVLKSKDDSLENRPIGVCSNDVLVYMRSRTDAVKQVYSALGSGVQESLNVVQMWYNEGFYK